MGSKFGLLILIGLIIAIGAGCGGDEESDYAAKNLDILEELPTPNGFTQESIEQVANAEDGSGSSDPEAVTTIVQYRPTGDEGADAPAAFYTDRLAPDWSAQDAVLNRGTITVQFCRNASSLSLNLDDPSAVTESGYTLAIDHDSTVCK